VRYGSHVHANEVLLVFHQVVDAVTTRLALVDDRALSGQRDGQYSFDLIADEVAIPLLVDAGFGVLSEESGLHHGERDIVVALDPVDGSTNFAHQIPWYACSLCAVDNDGPWVAVVANLAAGDRFVAVRGEGAQRNGRDIQASGVSSMSDALLAMNGWPSHHFGWRQYRSLGATALDLCAVADGSLDGVFDATPGELAPWDYLGGLLVCHEAGAIVVDGNGANMVTLDHQSRRRVIAAATPELLDQLLANI